MNMIEALNEAHDNPGKAFARPVTWAGSKQAFYYVSGSRKPRLKRYGYGFNHFNANIPPISEVLEEWEVISTEAFNEERKREFWAKT